jgi:hypothetical protein
VAARVVLALLAILVLGWAGVLLRDLELGQEATFRAYFGPSASPAQRDRDLGRLEDAVLLDPSSKWDLARASYYLISGDRRRAAGVAEALVRDEPSNLLAWTILNRATQSDRARSASAAAEIRRLNPLGSR